MFSCILLALLLQQSLSQSLDYVCTQSGEVKILKLGIEQYQWMYASGVRDAHDSQPCVVSGANDTTAGYGIKFIISGCDLMSVIHVTITTAKEDKNIIGGMGAIGFEIKCNGIYEGGENKSLVQTVLSNKFFIFYHFLRCTEQKRTRQEIADTKWHRQKRNTPGEDDIFSPLAQSLEAKFVVVDSEGSRTFGASDTKPINVLCFAHLVVIAFAVLASYDRLC